MKCPLIKLAIKDFFLRELEGICIRAAGIFRDGFLDDGTGEILVILPEAIPSWTRVDVIGHLYEDRLEAFFVKEISFKRELRLRELAVEYSEDILRSGFGPYGPLDEEIERAKAFILNSLKEPLSHDELMEAAKSEGVQKLAMRIALKRLLSEGEVIEIEPGVYYL